MINKLIENGKKLHFLLILFQVSEFVSFLKNATKMKNLVPACFFFFFFFFFFVFCFASIFNLSI